MYLLKKEWRDVIGYVAFISRGVPESGGVVRKDEHEVKESRESGMAEQAAEESGTVKKKKKREAESKNPQAPPRSEAWSV